MRVVLFTSASALDTELFRYLSAHVLHRFPDTRVVAVDAQAAESPTFSRWLRKIQRLGLADTLLILSSWPLQRWLGNRDAQEIDRLLAALPRPAHSVDRASVAMVTSVNGADTRAALDSLKPDVIIQAGAGLLKPNIFQLAARGTLNLHHGIAPLIRGMHSVYWAVWERKPEWLGATVHKIDEGIDTGPPLAYCPLAGQEQTKSVPELFALGTEAGVAAMVKCLERLERAEVWSEPVPDGPREYRSTFSGWQMLGLKLRRR